MQLESLIKTPRKNLRLAAILFACWQIIVCVLAVWWAYLLLEQGNHIVELEKALGMSPELSALKQEKTERMLYWESSVFIILLIGGTGFLSWIYYRDLKRTRSMQAFFASFTHELKTPLTSIRLQAEALEEVVPAQDKKLITRLLEDTVRLQSQVERTLELARIEGGGSVHPRPIECKPYLEKIIKNIEEQWGSDIRIHCSVQNELILADPNALQMIFRNLVENSVRHSNQTPVDVKIESTKHESDIILSVVDNGKEQSMPRKLGTLFEKGVSSQGAGVGLYLVHTLMKQFGGDAVFSNGSHGFKTDLVFKGSATHG